MPLGFGCVSFEKRHKFGMAGAAFPLAKLGFLIVRQASRPIANSITRRARASTIFRDWICVPTAQAFHWCDVKVTQINYRIKIIVVLFHFLWIRMHFVQKK